jgi:hypothetical protein
MSDLMKLLSVILKLYSERLIDMAKLIGTFFKLLVVNAAEDG